MAVIEVTLDREPANEIGTAMLAELEQFVAAIPALAPETSACIIYQRAQSTAFPPAPTCASFIAAAEPLSEKERLAGVRSFLERIHAVSNAIDTAPFVTIAAVHGVCFGGGLELALACDIIVADKMARFAFPELRLGLIPGFGGIPRLKRDLGNAFVRELLLTGRTRERHARASRRPRRATRGRGRSAEGGTATAAQITKFDPVTRAAAKKFIKPIPHDELHNEIDLFCELFTRPAVMAALRKFVESTDAMPYLP